MSQVLFETVGVGGLQLMADASAAAVANGRASSDAVVLDCGAHSCRAVVVRRGRTVGATACRLDRGGETAVAAVAERAGASTLTQIAVIRRQICERSSVSEAGGEDEVYGLPDGGVVRCKAVDLWLPNRSALSQLVNQCLERCEPSQRSLSVVLVGGASNTKGLVELLRHQLPGREIVAIPERRYSVCFGLSMAAALPGMIRWIDKAEYDEAGPDLINTRTALG